MKPAIFLVFFACLTLTSCSKIKDTFGIGHYQADEFAIDPNPPLTIPSYYKLKKPGKTGIIKPKKKHKSLLPAAKKASNNHTEKAALNALKNGKKVPKNIRKLVENESKEEDKSKLAKSLSSFAETFKRNLKSLSN